MINFIKNLFNRKKLPPHDIMDWRNTKTSKSWFTDRYCPQCKETSIHRERMSSICSSCGYYGDLGKFRSSRMIWNGKKWVRQFKYGNKKEDMFIDENNEINVFSEW